jgi:hypothetical protein
VAGDARAFLIAACIFKVAGVASLVIPPGGPNPVR